MGGGRRPFFFSIYLPHPFREITPTDFFHFPLAGEVTSFSRDTGQAFPFFLPALRASLFLAIDAALSLSRGSPLFSADIDRISSHLRRGSNCVCPLPGFLASSAVPTFPFCALQKERAMYFLPFFALEPRTLSFLLFPFPALVGSFFPQFVDLGILFSFLHSRDSF